ncbi:MAG: DUF5689 domain-containing protein [Chitinophagales bacterium]|nr:DUF5689 domain-containing protein [Chitinophagales bacterium]
MKNINSLFKTLFVALVATTLFSSCIKDKFDTPQPLPDTDPNLAVNMTIEELKNLYKGKTDTIKEDYIITGTVISDDQQGNVYQTLIIQDATGGVGFRIQRSDLFTDYPFGRKVYVKLKGLSIGAYNNLIQLGIGDDGNGSVNVIGAEFVEDFIVKGPRNQTVTPREITIAELSEKYQNTLIKLKDVQFIQSEAGVATYADAEKKLSKSTKLEDCSGKTIELRTSGYAKFAGTVVPQGKGDVVCIYQIFKTSNQLLLNKVEDVKLDNPERCDGGPIEPGDTTAPSQPGAGAVLLFPGADFEDFDLFKAQLNSFGLQSYATLAGGLGKTGNAIAIKGTPAGNDYVFTVLASASVKIPAGATKLSFYVKGTSAKSLSLNVYGGSGFTAFNVKDLGKNSLIKSSAANDYIGAIDTKGQWVLVTLDLTGVNVADPINQLFALKVGKEAAYDLLIDDIKVW